MKYFTIFAACAVSLLTLSACETARNDDAGYAVSRTAGSETVVFTDTSSTGTVFSDQMLK